jgi:hypothetical protein
MLMVDLIVETTDERMPDDRLELMGATEEAARRHGAGSDAVEIGAAARKLLAEHSGPGSMWDLWLRRDDVAARTGSPSATAPRDASARAATPTRTPGSSATPPSSSSAGPTPPAASAGVEPVDVVEVQQGMGHGSPQR